MRLRSANLREVLQDRKKWWVQQVQGSSLVADGLTKPLQGQQFMRYRQMLKLRPGDELGERKKIARLETRQESKKDDWKTLARGLCGGGLALLLRGDTKAGCLLMVAAAGLLKYEGWVGPKDRQENNNKTAVPNKNQGRTKTSQGKELGRHR